MKARDKIIILIMVIVSIVSGCVENKYQDPISFKTSTGADIYSVSQLTTANPIYKLLSGKPTGWYAAEYSIFSPFSPKVFSVDSYIDSGMNRLLPVTVTAYYVDSGVITLVHRVEIQYTTNSQGISETVTPIYDYSFKKIPSSHTFSIEINPNKPTGYYKENIFIK